MPKTTYTNDKVVETVLKILKSFKPENYSLKKYIYTEKQIKTQKILE